MDQELPHAVRCSRTRLLWTIIMKYALIILMVIGLYSCATYYPPPEVFPPDHTGPAYMEISYSMGTLTSGASFPLFAKIMDKNRNPLAGETVTVSIDEPALAYFFEDQTITNRDGIAEFLIIGLDYPTWPDYATVTFRAGQLLRSIKVYGPLR